MLEFELDKAVATLVNFNARTEKNGKDRVPATSLHITFAQSADVLAHFSPNLRAFLFDEDLPKDLAGGIKVRDNHLEYPLKRDEVMRGAEVKISFGIDDQAIELDECTLKDFEITPVDGGSVQMACTILCKPDPWKQVPQLYLLNGQGIEITVEPAELPTMKEAEAA